MRALHVRATYGIIHNAHDRYLAVPSQIDSFWLCALLLCTQVPRRAATACRAASGGAASNPLLVGLIEALFRFPPFFQAASRNARAMIVKRGEALGLPWKTAMERMQAQDWASAIEAVRNPAVKYPAYYTSPFHAYPEGAWYGRCGTHTLSAISPSGGGGVLAHFACTALSGLCNMSCLRLRGELARFTGMQ